MQVPAVTTDHAARALASRLRRTLTGPMWHGPTVMELLRSVGAEQALRHPVQSAHSIWELVLHMTTWARIARQRIDGSSFDYPDEQTDWPRPPRGADADAWVEAMQRLSDAYEALAVTVRTLDADTLQKKVQNNDHTIETMISGVIEHGVYHGGQIAILLKADAQRTASHQQIQS